MDQTWSALPAANAGVVLSLYVYTRRARRGLINPPLEESTGIESQPGDEHRERNKGQQQTPGPLPPIPRVNAACDAHEQRKWCTEKERQLCDSENNPRSLRAGWIGMVIARPVSKLDTCETGERDEP